MIATINGKLKFKSINQIIVDVNGIGYSLNVSKNTLDKIGNIEDIVFLYTDLQVRDDSMLMYGFKFESELNMFKLLQSIQGIGPRASLSILSALNVQKIVLAIKSSDKSAFQLADGIGQRVATRIVTELQEKINKFSIENNDLNLNLNIDKEVIHQNEEIVEDAISAMVNLGYTKSDAFRVINSILSESIHDGKPSIEKIIPLALKKLSK